MNNSSATTSSATNPASSLAYYTQILMTIQFGVSLVGFFLNLALLWIILKTKIRRNNYDIQLGALSLFDSVSMTSAFFTMFLALMDQTVSLLLCWLFQSISIFGSTCSFMIIFFISADRFWATIFPLHYNNLMSDKMKRRRYMTVILVAPQFVGLLTMTAYGAAVIESGTAEKRVTCQSGDLSMSFARRFTLATSLIFNISTVVIYSAIWFFVKVRKISSGVKDRVSRSLMLIIATTLFFWCLSTTFNNFITPLIDNQLVQMVSSRLFIIALKIVAAINLPMVYVCCADYRKLINAECRKLFGCICCFCAKMNAATHPTNTTHMVAASPVSINGVNHGRAAARQQQQIRRGI